MFLATENCSGSDFGKPGAANCVGVREPVKESKIPAPASQGIELVKGILGEMETPPLFLDVSLLTQLRPDAHPQNFASPQRTTGDCTHWCLAGVPDSWNLLLFSSL